MLLRPHQLLWELLISELASHLTEPTQILVCLEETCKFHCFIVRSFDHICGVVVRIKVNQMLAGEMDLQTNTTRGFAMHVEMENPPCSFRHSQETAINMFMDFVVNFHFK